MKRTPIKKHKQDGNKDAKSIAGREGEKLENILQAYKTHPRQALTVPTTPMTHRRQAPTVPMAPAHAGHAITVPTMLMTPRHQAPTVPMAPSTQTWQTLTIMMTVLMLKRRTVHRPTHNKQPSPKELPTVTKATLSNQILNTQTMMHPVKKMTRMQVILSLSNLCILFHT